MYTGLLVGLFALCRINRRFESKSADMSIPLYFLSLILCLFLLLLFDICICIAICLLFLFVSFYFYFLIFVFVLLFVYFSYLYLFLWNCTGPVFAISGDVLIIFCIWISCHCCVFAVLLFLVPCFWSFNAFLNWVFIPSERHFGGFLVIYYQCKLQANWTGFAVLSPSLPLIRSCFPLSNFCLAFCCQNCQMYVWPDWSVF